MKNFISVFGCLCLLLFWGAGEVRASEKLEIIDQYQQVWSSGATIDVFYDGTDDLLFPGETGDYRFKLHNRTKKALPVTFKMWEDNQYQVPLHLSLTGEAGGLLSPGRLLTAFQQELVLAPDEERWLQLDWQWAEEDHQWDSYLGSLASQELLVYHLYLEVSYETEDDKSAIDVNDEKQQLAESPTRPLLPSTGDVRQYWWVYCGWLLWMIAFRIRRGGQHNEKLR